MTRWSLFLQTLSLLHHFLGLYSEIEWDTVSHMQVGVAAKCKFIESALLDAVQANSRPRSASPYYLRVTQESTLFDDGGQSVHV